ncbi:MAG: ABC transporter substrate-binding protein [Syntrophus sp. (in: bacteria)]|nr:ABC transporter substrate-binding protein [Syntrophus sp. (in: bacteria)]
MKRVLTALVVAVFLAATAVSGLAQEKKVYNWKMATTWSQGIPWHKTAEQFARFADIASGGQLKIKVFADGAIVPAFEVFDAVRNGVVEMGHDWPGYWKGKNEAFVAFGSVPFGLNNVDYSIWLFGDKGWDMARELYGKFGIVPFPAGNSGCEMGFFTKTPMNDMRQLKGKKVRTVGWLADILTQMGIGVSPLPGGEVYLALDRGVIDSAEFSTPFITFPLGFHEIAKNVIMPGWHQPGVQLMTMVNKKAYDSLPPELQKALEVAAYATQMWDMTTSEKNNGLTIAKYKAKGVKFHQSTPASLNELRKVTKTHVDALKAKNPDLKKVLDSQDAYIKDMADWKQIRSGVSAYPYEMYIKGVHNE